MKQKVTVILALLALLVLPAFSSFSEEWTLLAEDGGVKAYYQLGTCDSRSVMFLKFENTLDQDVKIDFHFLLANNLPTPTVIDLKALETITGQCVGSPDLLKDVLNASPAPHVSMRVIN